MREATAFAEPESSIEPASTNVRRASVDILALMAGVVFLHWAQAVFIPITFSLLLSYALTPVVDWLRRAARLPKFIGAALTLFVGLVAVGLIAMLLQPQALNVLDLIPRAMQKLSQDIKDKSRTAHGAVSKIKNAASEIEKAANAAGASSPATSAIPTKPDATSPGFRINDYILMGTVGLGSGIGQFIVVVALVYFLLIAGDTFRRTLMRVSSGTLSRKKITLQLLDEIDSQIQRYLLVQIATSALLGFVAWLLLAWIGLENAAMWGCIGGVLHLVPYAGPVAFIGLVTLVAYVQFDTLQPVLLVLSSMTAGNSLVGLLLVPWLTQRVGSLNAVTVFVALLAWGWLWGIWGLLLGVPIMMAIKAICDRVEDLQPISAFLGHPPSKGKIEDAAKDATHALQG